MTLPLSTRDRLILEIAAHGPDPRLHLGALLTFPGPPPTPEQLADHVRGRLPELTFKADPERRHWIPDSGYDPRAHIHTLTVPGDVLEDPAPALNAVLDLPLDPGRPLWGLWICTPATGDGFALAYRAHHAFQDGRAVAETVDRLFGPSTAHRGTGTITGSAKSAALLKDLLPAPRRRPAPWPPAEHMTGAARRAALGTYDVRRLHTVVRATRAGLSHITLAALTGALRAWHPDTWHAASAPLGATFAVSVRAADDPHRLLGNRGAVAVLPLPCHEPSPAAQLAALRTEASPERLAELAGRHTVLFDHLPYWCARLGLSRTIDPRRVPLALADVRLRTELAWQGRRAHAAFLVPPSVPGQPLFVAWTVHRGHLRVTFLADTGVPGLDALPGHFDDALTCMQETSCL
ncbi:wax ester/triacylglycerol synthase domain-containing protein [Streptomyces acidiscabies]|uniref:wax ester/triacylglycerol synthase domain-containing protein n=1 Tax=Streptomyces acidiscabies TaxID=42234 RepID=UPI000969CC5F|nr:wax ester/triacylglycerol synthase domain-containing protein [Streptomyces acidiscabies]GAV39733.1 O-acyltransferase WSD [Streptomyces acidiscabies]